MIALAMRLVFILLLFSSIASFQKKLMKRALHQKFSSSILSQSSTEIETPAAENPLYDLKAWQSGYVNCDKEVCEVISNDLPKDLKGTYYRNGPSQFVIGEDRIMHPFDGDGMIAAVTFEDGAALFRNRFVRTKTFEKERKAKRILTRGTFGTQKSGGWFSNIFRVDVRNAANTNVLYWGGRLYALFESSNPHLIEADALRTIGSTTLNGVLEQEQPLTAHPRIDANSKRLIMFSSKPSLAKADLIIYEFDQSFNVIHSREFTIPSFVFLHDFVVTKNYYIFVNPPLDFKPGAFILGRRGIGECISMRSNEPTTVYIVPRDNEKYIKEVKVDAHFNFHFSNAYETSDGNIVLDTIRCPEFGTASPSKIGRPVWETSEYDPIAPFSRLERYVFGRSRKNDWVHLNEKPIILVNATLDFPVINPRCIGKEYQYVYGTLCANPDSTSPSPVKNLIKVDVQSQTNTRWLCEPHEFLNEIMFAPRSGTSADAAEDDGYLLTYLWNGRDQCTELLVFDAKDITKGPTHRVPVPVKIGHGLHGSYVPDLIFDASEVIKKFTQGDIL